VFLDFNGGDIREFIVNGKVVENQTIMESWKENKIYLNNALLNDSEINEVQFSVINKFNNDQFGFVIGHDPDGGRYVYIQTVPYYASRILPMFDQPDLKGTYEMSVIHSDKDTCVTTGPLLSTDRLTDVFNSEVSGWSVAQAKKMNPKIEGSSISVFERTPYLSTYLLNLVCGPLVSISATPEQQYNGISMKVMCRRITDVNYRIFS
jgi:aminopeptidase N